MKNVFLILLASICFAPISIADMYCLLCHESWAYDSSQGEGEGFPCVEDNSSAWAQECNGDTGTWEAGNCYFNSVMGTYEAIYTLTGLSCSSTHFYFVYGDIKDKDVCVSVNCMDVDLPASGFYADCQLDLSVCAMLYIGHCKEPSVTQVVVTCETEPSIYAPACTACSSYPNYCVTDNLEWYSQGTYDTELNAAFWNPVIGVIDNNDKCCWR